jgi:hypothetical protein
MSFVRNFFRHIGITVQFHLFSFLERDWDLLLELKAKKYSLL